MPIRRKERMPVEQIRVGEDNFSYLIYDSGTKHAALVDPGSDASRALEMAACMGLDLKYLINTHHHWDHTGDNGRVLESTEAELVISSSGSSDLIGQANILVDDGSKLELADTDLRFIHTPGHTPGSICILVDEDYLITGDTLFIGDCGRCDLPGGSLEEMYGSLQRLKGMDDGLIVLPGHDYGPKPKDTLGNQKRTNKVMLALNLGEFSRL